MDEIDKDFMKFFESTGKAFAWGDMPGAIIAALYIEPEAIAMEDIAKKTGYSLAMVSNVMKSMEAMGFVQRTKKPKTRKVFFYMDKDIVQLNKQKLVVAYENGIKPAKTIIPMIINKYKGKMNDKRSEKKLQLVEEYYRQILAFEKILLHMIEDIDTISLTRNGKI
jgi:DNA-binding transcriptional regulator GbsR (MarR family)